jgi:hypothetical protein
MEEENPDYLREKENLEMKLIRRFENLERKMEKNKDRMDPSKKEDNLGEDVKRMIDK